MTHDSLKILCLSIASCYWLARFRDCSDDEDEAAAEAELEVSLNMLCYKLSLAYDLKESSLAIHTADLRADEYNEDETEKNFLKHG